MTSQVPLEVRRRALQQGIVLARVGVGAWTVVVAIAVVLVALLRPWYLWALLVAFGALRLVLDVRRLRALGRDLAELDEPAGLDEPAAVDEASEGD